MRSVQELSRLDGRVALVTGARGHLGGAAVQALRECGALVAGADRAEASVSNVGDAPDAFHAVDLLDESSTRALVREVVMQHGRLDILVHCAAFVGTSAVPGWAVPFQEQSVDAWDKAIRVNLTSAFIMIQEGREALAQSRHGTVVLVSSIYGMVGPDNRLYAGTSMANPAGYGASKAGLELLGRHLSTVLAPKVRVNTLTPGGIARGQADSFRTAYEARVPLQRMGSEEDFKGAIAYLSSDLSAYVTGQNLVVDGGWTAW